MEIGIDLPHEMTVHVDERDAYRCQHEDDVAGVLAEAGIQVGPKDLLIPDLQTRPTDGLSIVIVRVTDNDQVETEPVPFTSTTVNDPTVLVGTKKVTQVGKNGTITRTYRSRSPTVCRPPRALVSAGTVHRPRRSPHNHQPIGRSRSRSRRCSRSPPTA